MKSLHQPSTAPAGHSAVVRGWLKIGETRHSLSQVGPDFCILRESRKLPATTAELIIEVDGTTQITRVKIATDLAITSQRVELSIG